MTQYLLSKTMFSQNAVLKTVYLLQKDFEINVSEQEYNFVLEITPRSAEKSFNWDDFNKQLLEQQLREQLALQFGTLRDSIYQKAFNQFKD